MRGMYRLRFYLEAIPEKGAAIKQHALPGPGDYHGKHHTAHSSCRSAS